MFSIRDSMLVLLACVSGAEALMVVGSGRGVTSETGGWGIKVRRKGSCRVDREAEADTGRRRGRSDIAA